MSFATALQIVHDALAQMHERGLDLRASAQSLARLREREVDLPSAFDRPPTSIHVAPSTVREASNFRSPASSAPAGQTTSLPHTGQTGSQPPSEKAQRLAELRGPVLSCTKCPHLVASRTQVVFGVGNPDAQLMFVGEAPGEDEDLQGEPFVGKAGQLLTKIIAAMGLAREDVYIGNVLKCRPDMPPGASGNRKPRADEMQTCLPYLRVQIEIIQPRVLVALGATAMEGLLGETAPMNRLRGRWHEFGGIPLMATYHPAYLLRNQALSEKRKVWEDMLLVLERLGLPISEKQRNFFLPK
ncbi:MAG: uracil-DNA glycosylase [Chthoniobacter sp.]|jgi:DNA polymerase|nr:uracil-DNA glycosylase [Chthoniobacter sp.]